MDFTGRVALITGAGKGIGRAYAEWLGAHGAKVVVNNRSHPGVPSSAQEVADVITRAGGTAIIDEHAVEDEASGQAMVEAALKAFGRLDILICNAGVSAQKKAVEDATLAEFDEIMRINFYGALHPLKAALPGMIANNYGRVVLTSSPSGLYGQGLAGPYAAAKMALVGLAKAMAIENRQRNVKVNVVSPYARTNMAKSIDPKFSELMSPRKLAPMVGWMCSEACTEGGSVYAVGAGRVRRVSVVEGPIGTMTGDDVSALIPELADLGKVFAPTSGTNSSLTLAPELAPRPR